MKKKYHYSIEEKQNPYIGFTSFQHFRNDALYSDLVVKPENNMIETEAVECYPVPDDVQEKGREQGYYPDCSVVYIRILWKEFEPYENEYNYSFIESILQNAKNNDQTVMFRLMQHSTRESDDVPDWLKEKIECPPRPKGMREKSCPSDPKFLEYFGRAIRAFGERFDSDPALSMVDISLPGAWGEGSHCDLFTEEQLKNFANIYTDVFKNTLLIGQISAPWLVNYLNKHGHIGWRADCIGPEGCYQGVVSSAEKFEDDFWINGHISFESYWWLGEWKRKDWDVDTIIKRLLDMHVSTFNAKSLPIPWEWKDKIDYFVSKMGYHFVIREVETSDTVKAGNHMNISIEIENVGVAPIYYQIPLNIKIKNKNSQARFPINVDIRKWTPGTHYIKADIQIPQSFDVGEYEVQIGIGGENTPSVCFATNAKQDGYYAVLTSINII